MNRDGSYNPDSTLIISAQDSPLYDEVLVDSFFGIQVTDIGDWWKDGVSDIVVGAMNQTDYGYAGGALYFLNLVGKYQHLVIVDRLIFVRSPTQFKIIYLCSIKSPIPLH